LGYLEKVESKLLINNEITKEVFEYNDRGFIKSKQFFDGDDTIPRMKFYIITMSGVMLHL